MGEGAPAAPGAPGGMASPSFRRKSVQGAQVALRISIALRRRLLPQLGRPLVALGNAQALVVQDAQVALRISIALRRRLLPQCDPPREIFGDARALVVQGAQVVLRISVALCSRLRIELSRPLVALGHALAEVIAHAQFTQRLRLAPGSVSHVLRGGRPDALGSGGGGRAPPAFADPHNLTRLPLRRRHPARRLVALPVRTLALVRAVVREAAAGAQPIRVVLLGCRATLARAYVAYAVHGGGGRGRCSAILIMMFDATSET